MIPNRHQPTPVTTARQPQRGHSEPTTLAKPRRPLQNAQITQFGRNEVANRGIPRAVQNGGYVRACTMDSSHTK
jgi:hypothetical protein